MEKKVIEVAALGRALHPGMLYDCRDDSFLPGITLWDKKLLGQNLEARPKSQTNFKISSSDSLSEKAKLLDVSASLKASFLLGMVEVAGSAKYLQDTKTSMRQSQVTLQYCQTTRTEGLNIALLGPITYPWFIDQTMATHVVTEVLYGAQACMVFDQTASDDADVKKIQGDLKVMIEKIPYMSIEEKGDVNMNENEKKTAENISCTFYGDYQLKENPTTYMEALQVYKKLPSMLREEGNETVPIKVWLYPLVLLNDKAAQLEKEISENLMSDAEQLLELMAEVDRRRNDLVRNARLNDFHDLKDRLDTFCNLFKEYRVKFKEALRTTVPKVRGGFEDEESLAILNSQYQCPIYVTKLIPWLEKTTNELDLLCSYITELKGIEIVKSSVDFEALHFRPGISTVICFNFSSLKYDDPYLSALKQFLCSKQQADPNTSIPSSQELQSCFSNAGAISEAMRRNLSLFKSFSEANKDKEGVLFVITSFADPDHPGASIGLYQNGALVDPQFQPVSKPPVPVVEKQGENASLKLQKSSTGDTVKFQIEYRNKNETATASWVERDTPGVEGSFPLQEMQTGVQYLIRYRAVGKVGVSEASEAISYTAGLGRLLLGSGLNWNISSLLNKLKKEINTRVRSSLWSPSAIQAEVTDLLVDLNATDEIVIPGGLKPGMALFYQGVVSENANRFQINHKSGWEDSGTAFHINPRIGGSIVYNTLNNGSWGREQHACNPLHQGSAFDIFIINKAEGYQVIVNGESNHLYKHRMPVNDVKRLEIRGGVKMRTVGVIQNWSESTFAKSQAMTMRTKLSNIQADVPFPVCNPRMPYFGQIPCKLNPGLALFFQGVVPSDSAGFVLNLVTTNSDIALCFSIKMNPSNVILNTCENGKWGDEEWGKGANPFIGGGEFDIFILNDAHNYEVIVNLVKRYKFAHRIPLVQVSKLDVHGDVFMNAFGIFEVQNTTLNAIIPANNH